MDDLGTALDAAYEAMEGSEAAEKYSRRHGIESLMILTVTDDQRAADVAYYLRERVRGKTVVEIGGGIGLLAMHLAEYAEKVYVIEASPVWSSVYVHFLHHRKPANVTFIFGIAEEMVGILRAHVALFCSHSGCDQLRRFAAQFAPEVIDVYGDVLREMGKADESVMAVRETLVAAQK
jgi:hypothetical protein